MALPQAHSAALSHLRRKIERLGTTGVERQTLPFGIEAIDCVLPGGGLALGAVHEICEQGTDGARASLSALFAAGILARLPGPVIWCLHSRDLFAPALARVGLHPDRVIYCETRKDAEVLPAMEESLRHGGLAGVVGELVRLPLTPSRRLQLAAEASGVIAFALRRSGSASDEANACFSRWRISPSPSGPMVDFEMGRRCRGAEAHTWTVEACDASGRLAVPADLGDCSDGGMVACHRLGGLPVAALRLAEKTIESLRDVGIERIAQLASKARGSLQTRFGSDFLLRMDQALGSASEVLVSLVPPEVPRSKLRFAEPLGDPEDLQRGDYHSVPKPGRGSRTARGWRAASGSRLSAGRQYRAGRAHRHFAPQS